MSRPSALAVFMLMTSSTFVACWTGRLVAHESPCLKHNRPELRNELRELLAGCGHRTQQERADEVSAAMIDFLRTLVAEQPDLTLDEIVTAIRAQGVARYSRRARAARGAGPWRASGAPRDDRTNRHRPGCLLPAALLRASAKLRQSPRPRARSRFSSTTPCATGWTTSTRPSRDPLSCASHRQ